MTETAADDAPQAALNGLRVLDFTHVIAGPYATQLLGDLGAEVTKVESIESGDMGRRIGPWVEGQSHYFLCFNRNKRSIALDLKSEEGQAVARSLAARADVVIENFGPGVMGRLGLSREMLMAENPGLVYCSISGFGQTGPLSTKRSFDLITQAFAGAMSANGDPDRPPLKLGIPIGDTAGSLFATIAILAALMRRRDTGRGEYIDLSLVDCLLPLLANHAGHALAVGHQPERCGSFHYFCVPNGVFPTADGHVAIAVTNDVQWNRLCKALGIEDMRSDPLYATMEARAKRRDDVNARVIRQMAQQSVAEVVAALDAADVPATKVNDISAALEEPHVAARNMLMALDHPVYGAIRVIASPFGAGLSRATATPPPLLGEDTETVLEELGYGQATIARLAEKGVIGVARPKETAAAGSAKA